GFPHKVWFYYLMGEPKKEKGLRQWFRRKLGEPPVLVASRALELNKEALEGYLHNEGYFRSEASGEVVPVKQKMAKAAYQVYVRPRYSIGEVTFEPAGVAWFDSTFLQSEKATFLQPGMPYRLSVIEAERIRIDQHLK